MSSTISLAFWLACYRELVTMFCSVHGTPFCEAPTINDRRDTSWSCVICFYVHAFCAFPFSADISDVRKVPCGCFFFLTSFVPTSQDPCQVASYPWTKFEKEEHVFCLQSCSFWSPNTCNTMEELFMLFGICHKHLASNVPLKKGMCWTGTDIFFLLTLE